MIPIAEPFKLDIDVTPDTPLSDVPESYWSKGKDRLHKIVQFDADLKDGLEKLSVNPDVEAFLMSEIHRTVSFHDDHVIRVAFAVTSSKTETREILAELRAILEDALKILETDPVSEQPTT